ncbi:MAG: HAD-IIB family hydrolase [Coleofasciculaceae cyanobacterium RL_1_1]|nr:HAD-IIB family hydrolase [Coleofasciculaceae cyanobacterium RL_1_1]
MTTTAPVIIFTDLDGTLLNAHDYRYDAAIPMLERLKALGIPVIPVTSKTRAEVECLRSAIGLRDPFVVENGSGIFIEAADDRFPVDTDQRIDGYQVIPLGGSYHEARDRVANLAKQLGVTLCGFGDLKPEDLYGITGLSIEEAKRAQSRDFTEPFMVPSNVSSNAITAAATSLGFRVVVGDRFSHAIDPRSGKGIAVKTLIDLYQAPAENLTIIGLGNSPNDLEMLNVVTHPIIIPAKTGLPHPRLADRGWPIATQHGSAGWAEAIGAILNDLGLTT